MISVNNLKTDSENDNENAGIPSFPLPNPTTSYVNDLDFFKDFENKFPAIFYNEAQTSKLDLLTELILSPQHIDEFNLNDKTSVSEYDEEEQNILYFNDLFPFNIIRPDNLKSEKDNNDNDIDMIQSSEDMAPLPPRKQRHTFLRYQGLEYTDEDIANFEERLERIYSREIHRVQVVDYQGMPELMRDGLFAMMVMEHRDDAGVVVFTSQARGRLFDTRRPQVRDLTLEFLSTLRFGEFILALELHTGEEIESPSFARYWSKSDRMIPEKGDLHDYWRGLNVRSVNVLYLLSQYLRRFTVGRKSGAHIYGGQFVARLAKHFGLLTAEILEGLMVIAPKLPIIDMGELVRLQICMEVDDTWAWVSIGPEKQPDAAAGAPRVGEDAPAVDEGNQAISKTMQAPQQPPPPPPAAAQTMP
ncbi:hypothetical protein Tco_1509485 [Tanacetum coccineum]